MLSIVDFFYKWLDVRAFVVGDEEASRFLVALALALFTSQAERSISKGNAEVI